MADIKVVKDNREHVLNQMISGIDESMLKIATVAQRYAFEKCPVDTGRLRNSITADSTRENGGWIARIGSNVEYAPYVELGARGRDPEHFLTDAVQNHLDEYKAIIIDTLKK